jgi:hypothetical protein
MGKNRNELNDEQRKKYEADALKKKQSKIRKEFEFLQNTDTLHFQAEFIKTQAKEICKYYNRVKLTPFKAWEGILRDIVVDEEFKHKFYLVENEYGELTPDEKRIDSLVLETLNPEDLAKNMF